MVQILCPGRKPPLLPLPLFFFWAATLSLAVDQSAGSYMWKCLVSTVYSFPILYDGLFFMLPNSAPIATLSSR